MSLAILRGKPTIAFCPLKYGTQGRTRTGTISLPGDFESPASTIPPLGHGAVLHKPKGEVQS